MSRTFRNDGGLGREYWKSRLHRHGEEPGRITKTLTHKKERRQGRKIDTFNDEKNGLVGVKENGSNNYNL